MVHTKDESYQSTTSYAYAYTHVRNKIFEIINLVKFQI